MCLQCKSFENSVEKGEIARNEQFLLFSVFSTPLKNFMPFSAKLKLSSANLLNLEASKNCRIGKGYTSLGSLLKTLWENEKLLVTSNFSFLAHLSTTCSGGAIVTGHRPASVRPSICLSVNNFFKNLLLQNQKASLDKTWQECSLGEAL